MEAEAIKAHNYWNEFKRNKVQEHISRHSNEMGCTKLSNYEWDRMVIKQKESFSRSKKFSCTRLWTHHRVSTEEGFLSLTINIIKK